MFPKQDIVEILDILNIPNIIQDLFKIYVVYVLNLRPVLARIYVLSIVNIVYTADILFSTYYLLIHILVVIYYVNKYM